VNHASEHVTQSGSGVAPASFDAESRIPSTADAALPVVQPARSSEWMFSAAEAGTGRPQEAGDEASGDPVWWRATEAAETVDDNGPEANWTPKAWAASHDEGAHDLGGALELLQSHSVIDRKDGLAELARLGPAAAAAVPVVRSLTHDDDPYVQAHAAWALWTITREGFETVPALTSLLNSDEAGVVQVSAYMLGAIGPDAIGSVDALRAVCSTPELETRLHAAEALSRITPNSTDAVQILVSTLNSADPQSRWLAAISLAGVAPSHRGAAIAALTSALGDADDGVCSVAALTLGGFGPDARSAVPHLERAASSDVADVRVAAQAALACIDR
jgi:HEAT repeat protein